MRKHALIYCILVLLLSPLGEEMAAWAQQDFGDERPTDDGEAKEGKPKKKKT